MSLAFEDVRRHWERWAKEFGTELRATTKTPTIKMLEIFALTQHIPAGSQVLDVGCGNGYNACAFLKSVADVSVIGVDYSPEMIANARKKAQLYGSRRAGTRVEFLVADALALPFGPVFDVATTDRCLINLTNIELQKRAIDSIAKTLKPGGLFLMLENSQQTHARQNDAREAVGLPRRVPADFNLFLDEDILLPHCYGQFDVVGVEDFGSLHDLVLYVLAPASNDGRIDYAHPAVAKAAQLTMMLSGKYGHYPFGGFGQNRLYVLRKKATLERSGVNASAADVATGRER